MPRGDDGARLTDSKPSLGDRVERSEPVRRLPVDRPPGERWAAGIEKSGDMGWKLGLTGDVAMGAKKGSTTGFVTAVWRAVRIRRGPAGFGTTMTSGNLVQELPGTIIDCTASLTSLKFARDVKWTITTWGASVVL